MKNTKRILSLFLAVLMMLSVVVALPVFADEGDEPEGNEGPVYVLEQDFEGYAEGAVLTANSNAPTGTGVAGDMPANNVVKVEETADGTNKYLHIPYTGHCDVRTGGSPGVNMTGNADRNYQLKHDQISYADARYGVIEIDYRWESDNTEARFECQFRSATGENSAGSRVGISWVSLFFLEMGNDTRGATKIVTSAKKTGVKAANPIDGQWNTFKLIFDLEEGTFDIYVNNVLYAQDGVFAQDSMTKHTNLIMNKDMFIAVKPNKCIDTYSEDRPGKDPDAVYVDVDNIKMYSVDDLIKINYDGRGMMVQSGQRLDFGTAGKTFVYAIITDESAGVTTYSTDPYVIIDKPLTIETVMLDGTYAVYEGFDMADDGATGKDISTLTGVTDALLETMTIVEEQDEITEEYNNYLKIPFSESLDKKQLTFKGESIDSAEVPVAIFEGKYLFSSNAKGTIAARLKSINWINDKGAVKTANNIQLFKIRLNGSGSAALEGVGDLVGDSAQLRLQGGTWFSIRIVMNLLTGTYKTYIDDTLYAENAYISTNGDDQGFRNIEITENSLVPMYFMMDDTVPADSYVCVDDIGLKHGPTVTFRLNNGSGTAYYTEFVDTSFSFKQKGSIFDRATVYSDLPEEEWYPLEDPDTFEPVLDENGDPVMVKQRTFEILEAEIIVTEDLDGTYIEAQYILTLASDNFDDPEENPGDAIVADGQVSEGVAILNPTNKTIGLYTPMMFSENGPYVFVADYLLKDAASSIKILAKDDRVVVTEPVELFVLEGTAAEEPAWVTVKIILDVENGTYVVYVDDVKAKEETIDTEFVLAENGITVEYVGETDAAIDNMELRYKKFFKISLDGAMIEVEENEIYSLYDKNRTFAYAYVYNKGIEADEEGNETEVKLNERFVTETAIAVEEDMVIARHYIDKFEMMDATARLGTPTGLRFVSNISKDAVSTFRYTEDGNGKRDFTYGTIIVPAAYLEEISGKITKEKLIDKYGADGILDIEGNGSSPKWYTVAGLSTNLWAFAGSISNVKTENLDKKFVGIGYVSFTLEDGQTVTIYANYNEAGESLSDVAEATLEEQGETLSPLMKTTLESFVVSAD